MKTLTKKELNEYPFVTLGRLKTAIEQFDNERALDLLKKVTQDMSDMDIKIMHFEREKSERENIENYISFACKEGVLDPDEAMSWNEDERLEYYRKGQLADLYSEPF